MSRRLYHLVGHPPDDPTFVRDKQADANAIYTKLAAEIGLYIRPIRRIGFKKTHANPTNLDAYELEMTLLAQISDKFHQLGEEFIYGDAQDNDYG